jgi:hypothetical protein
MQQNQTDNYIGTCLNNDIYAELLNWRKHGSELLWLLTMAENHFPAGVVLEIRLLIRSFFLLKMSSCVGFQNCSWWTTLGPVNSHDHGETALRPIGLGGTMHAVVYPAIDLPVDILPCAGVTSWLSDR